MIASTDSFFAGSALIQPIATNQDLFRLVQQLPTDTIIFLDVDDTIITPMSKTFRAPPYNQLIDEIKGNSAAYTNYEEIISNWRLQRKTRLIELSWPAVINQLKEKFRVYGLTKLDTGKFGNIDSMERWRHAELASLDIVFSPQPPDKNSTETVLKSTFYQGILFTGANSKSETIAEFRSTLQTSTIVIVDDRLNHLKDIAAFCQTHQITFMGIHYQGLAALKETQDPQIFELQKKQLLTTATWLEDAEAEEVLAKAKAQPMLSKAF